MHRTHYRVSEGNVSDLRFRILVEPLFVRVILILPFVFAESREKMLRLRYSLYLVAVIK
jgi:hypothetical protein